MERIEHKIVPADTWTYYNFEKIIKREEIDNWELVLIHDFTRCLIFKRRIGIETIKG